MYDFLVNHAVRNVWCAPSQDATSIRQPAKVTPAGGIINRLSFQSRVYNLPTQSTYYHVYSLGARFASAMGIFNAYTSWTLFSDICNNENLIVDIYSDTGIQLPRFRAWFMVTPDKTAIVAIEDTDTISVDLDTDTIFMRFYRNAYYNSPEAAALPAKPYVQVTGMVIATTANIATMQTKYTSYAGLSGIPYAFVNGARIGALDPFTVSLGDCVEIVYDGSIYKVVDFPIANLSEFTSTLDSKFKYLLHYPGLGDSMIDYQDEVDMFLFPTPDTNGYFTGYYLHKNAGDTLRMVTNKDYAVPTAYVQDYANDHSWSDLSNLVLRMHIRYGGMNRPLVYDNNRIQELYKMEDADVAAAMLGIDSTVTNWQASVLEAAPYTQIMREDMADITNAMVEGAYGYNAITKIVADTPSMAYSASERMVIDVPYLLQTNSTMYEYDSTGKLLGWYNHTTGSLYSCTNPTAAWVEVIAGAGSNALDENYGAASAQALNAVASYRMYTCPYVNGEPDVSNWTDVTGSAKYAIVNDSLTWLTDSSTTYTLVRGNTIFLAYLLNLSITDGVLQFDLQHLATRDFLTSMYDMEIPMGELDLWLNGYSLIEGVDYVYNFPSIVITNKKFLVNPETDVQAISIRYTGFCQSDLSRLTVRDYGFVQYDRLSNNNKFDLRDDKVIRINVGGGVLTRDGLLFAEDDAAVTVVNATNGQPYEIRPMIIPLRGIVDTDTYDLLAQAEAIDDAVGAYLTLKIPESDPTTPSAIETPWYVYSPFCCKILNDMINGILTPPAAPYSDAAVKTACASYESLLAFDQTQSENAVDANFVQIDPHNLERVVEVTSAQYIFLQRAVSLYLNGLVNLSHFLSISS